MPPPTASAPEDPALLTAQLLLRIGFGVLAIAVPVTAAFYRRAPFVLLPFGAGLIIIAALLTRPDAAVRRVGAAMRSPIGIAALFLGGWAALSLFWAPYHHDAGQRLFKTTLTIVVAAVTAACLPERMRLSSLYLIPIGVGAAGVMTFVSGLEGARSGSTDLDMFTLERAAITLVVMAWPALAALAVRGRFRSAGGLAIVIAAAGIAARSPVSVVALGMGALAYAAARARPRRAFTILATASALVIFFAPALPFLIRGFATVTAGGLPDWMQPVGIWADLVYTYRTRLVTGHGLETVLHGIATGILPAHTPRSLLFAIWYELGLLGGATTAFLAARAFVSAGRSGPTVAPFLAAELLSGLVFSAVGHDPAQLWWLTLLGVVAICFAGVTKGQYRTTRPTARPVVAFSAPQPQQP
jgi:hypothetical protein